MSCSTTNNLMAMMKGSGTEKEANKRKENAIERGRERKATDRQPGREGERKKDRKSEREKR